MIYKSEVCRGSLGFGTPCGKCERCNEFAALRLADAIALVNASGTHVVVPVVDLEKLACRRVKHHPLWWQRDARAMLSASLTHSDGEIA